MTIGIPVAHRARARSLTVVLALLAAFLSGGWFVQHGAREGKPTLYEGARLFDNVMNHVEKYYVDTLDAGDLYRKAVDGLLYELGDPYTAFLPPDKLGKLAEATSGNYSGLGLQVEIRDGAVVVVAPLPGGPAERAGILTGDRIVEAGGKSTQGWTLDEVNSVFRGNPGETVILKIDRPGLIAPLPFSLIRRAIHLSAVRRAAMLPAGVGYVDVKAFSDSTAKELTRAIDSLAHAGMRGLIIDLRSNPGGLLSQGVEASDLFLDPGQRIVSLRGRIPGSNADYSDGKPQQWPKLPITVLVDGRSASASEIVAGALQDHDRAVIIGRPTYGKGSAQSLYPLGSAGGLKLTTARWYTPSGRSINKWVVRDDIEFGGEPKAEEAKSYNTDAGRKVFGGGGITPDILAGDTVVSADLAALQTALGNKVTQFRDAITEYSLELKASGRIKSRAFTVTPEMREELWKRVGNKKIDIPKSVYDNAAPSVSRILEFEIARYVFGLGAEFDRRASRDPVISRATSLLAGSPNLKALLARVPQVTESK